MAYRSRNPLAGGVVDVETARRAVAQVARERDAVARQLQQAQARSSALERELEARDAERLQLERRVRELEARVSAQAAAAQHQEQAQQAERARQAEQAERARQAQEAEQAQRARRAQQFERHQQAERPGAAEGERVQRLAADLANLRRHQADAIARGIRQQTDRFLIEIASVRDSVQRALDALPDGVEGRSPWHDGLLAVLARIDGVLEREGVHRTGDPGERFDPQVHEAIGTVNDGHEGYVRQTVSTGLVRDDGAVITPAKVLVGAPADKEVP